MELGSPTLDEASVKLLSIVLFPLEGLPTRPINVSRGIARGIRHCSSKTHASSISSMEAWGFRINVFPVLPTSPALMDHGYISTS